MYVRVYVRTSVRVRLRVCMRVCVCVRAARAVCVRVTCVRVCVPQTRGCRTKWVLYMQVRVRGIYVHNLTPPTFPSATPGAFI